jgi:N-methylhydantoinase A
MSGRRPDGARLGVDIGGTFTDIALELGGQRFTAKTLTTPQAPEQGVLEGIKAVIEVSGLKPDDVSIIIHGTTLATNALIERKGAVTALLTTAGHRDSVEIGTESRFAQYDVYMRKGQPLVPRYLRFGVPERVDARGRVLVPLDTGAVEALAPRLKDEGVTSVAVGYLYSFMHPDHERRTAEILSRHLPGLSITLSSDVSPEMREYERLSTACANAYVRPLMARYLTDLGRTLKDMGFSCPLFMMLSGGGITTLETAVRFPIRLAESGPAGGAIFANDIARRCGLDSVLSFDMGGTTAKICLIDGGAPQTKRSVEVAREYRFLKGSGLPLRVPVIDMVEIGAGGGSIARIDRLNRIVVGPDSAGADPGPACYGHGGDHATVTDADVVLGRIDPHAFAGGRFALDAEKAGAVVQRDIGEGLDLSLTMAAFGISEIVEENMASAARVHAIESGKTFADRTLIAFGGAAPLHACRFAEKLEIGRVIVPASAGVGSAVGFLRAPVAYEVVRSKYQHLASIDFAGVNAVLDAMAAAARAVVERGALGMPTRERRSAFMRYLGQAHEVEVDIPVKALADEDVEVIRAAFEGVYRHRFGRLVAGVDIEIMSWKVTVGVEPGEEVEEQPAPPEERHRPPPAERRPVFQPAAGEFVTVDIFRREDLRAGAEIRGPAVIAERETSTVVSAFFDALVSDWGIVMTRRAEGRKETP